MTYLNSPPLFVPKSYGKPSARHAFMLYTTLSGEPWFPCQILAYLYAVSDQRKQMPVLE